MISKIFYATAILLLFSTCSKKDCGLNGSWKCTSSSFWITTNETIDVSLIDRSWQGLIRVDSSNINTQVHCYYDNTSGVSGLTSDSITITLHGNTLKIHFRDLDYTFSNPYMYSKEKGLFKAQGIAQGNGMKISVNIDITAQIAKLEKGKDLVFMDQMFSEIPFQDIRFDPNGKSVGHYRTGDMVIAFNGTYTINSNIISLHFSSGEIQYNYALQYQQNNDSLYLSKACEYNDYESYSSIPFNRIATIKCQSQFQSLNN